MATKGNYAFTPGQGWTPAAPPPALVTSSFDPRFQVAIEPAQVVPTAQAAPAPSQGVPVVVQNPDGSLSVQPLTTSTMPPAAPQLFDADPGGTSGFNLAPRSQVASSDDAGEGSSGALPFIIGGVVLALILWSR